MPSVKKAESWCEVHHGIPLRVTLRSKGRVSHHQSASSASSRSPSLFEFCLFHLLPSSSRRSMESEEFVASCRQGHRPISSCWQACRREQGAIPRILAAWTCWYWKSGRIDSTVKTTASEAPPSGIRGRTVTDDVCGPTIASSVTSS